MAQGFGLLLGTVCMNPKTAQTIASIVVLAFTLVGGYFVRGGLVYFSVRLAPTACYNCVAQNANKMTLRGEPAVLAGFGVLASLSYSQREVKPLGVSSVKHW